jgi:hypothetical protein
VSQAFIEKIPATANLDEDVIGYGAYERPSNVNAKDNQFKANQQ